MAVRLTNATLLVLTTVSCCYVISDREAIPIISPVNGLDFGVIHSID